MRSTNPTGGKKIAPFHVVAAWAVVRGMVATHPAGWAVALVAGELVGFALEGWWCCAWVLPAFVAGFAAVACACRGVSRKAMGACIAILGLALAWRSCHVRSERIAYVTVPGMEATFVLGVDKTLQCEEGKAAFVSMDDGVAIFAEGVLGEGQAAPKAGQKWRVQGRCRRVGTLRTRLYIEGKEGNVFEHTPQYENTVDAIRKAYAAVQEKAAEMCKAGVSKWPGLSALDAALLLGVRTDMPEAERQTFVDAGTVHIFAVSGLHVMLVAFVMARILRASRMPPRVRAAILLPCVFAYVMLTGARPSAMRAGFMAAMLCTADISMRQRNSVAALALTALVLYGLDPDLVHDAGCTFSFAVMVWILAGVRLFGGLIRPLLPCKGRRPGWAMRTLHAALICVGINGVAWIAGMGISATVFGKFSFGAIVAGPIVVTFAAWHIVFSAMGVCATYMWLPLGTVPNALAAFTMAAMAFTSRSMAAMPWMHFEFEPWDYVRCAMWYVSTSCAMLALRRLMAEACARKAKRKE